MVAKKRTEETELATYVDRKDAQVQRERKTVLVEEELDQIHERDGVVTAQSLVEAASSPKHRLHRFFEWDDSEAAKKFRLTQATAMIMATKYMAVLEVQRGELPRVVAANKVPSLPVRKFVRAKDGGYHRRDLALEDEEERRLLVESKRAILVGWCRAVVDIHELDSLRLMLQDALGIESKAA
jgi:hypothetical protein